MSAPLANPRVNDSGDLLVMLQGIRRAFPRLTTEMNLLIDLLCDGPVALEIDAALARMTARTITCDECHGFGRVPIRDCVPVTKRTAK